MKKNVKAMNADELKKTVEAYKTRRQSRLDAAETANADGEGQAEFEEAKAENADGGETVAEGAENAQDAPSIDDRVKLIRDRRDRRDAEGDPAEKDGAMGMVARQDEDIDELLKIIEALQAEKDFAKSESNADCDMGGGGGGGVEVSGGGKEIIIKTDAKDEIKQRVELGLLGRELKLDGLEEKKPIDAKRAVLKKLRPKLNLDGKSASYIDVVYELALEERKNTKDTNYQRKQVFNGDSRAAENLGVSKSQKARAEMLERTKNGGKK